MRVINTDPVRWIGFTNDPAETVSSCAWIRLGPWTLHVWPFNCLITKGRF